MYTYSKGGGVSSVSKASQKEILIILPLYERSEFRIEVTVHASSLLRVSFLPVFVHICTYMNLDHCSSFVLGLYYKHKALLQEKKKLKP